MRSLLPRLLLAVFLTLGGCSKKPDPLEAAQHFFEQVGSGQADQAYYSTAFGFQAQRSASVFAAAVRDMGFTGYTGAEWGKPEREDHSFKIPVTLTTRKGDALPQIVTLIYESGAWRVFSIHSPPSAETGIAENRFTLVGKVPTFTAAVTSPVPPENEVRQLVRENLLHFSDAIASKSFDAFYDSVSLKWQDQLTKGELQRAFQPFIDKKIDLSPIAKLTPVFDVPTAVNSDGLLVISGHYEAPPYKIVFTMRFFYELPSWKLFGLDINMVKQGTQETQPPSS